MNFVKNAQGHWILSKLPRDTEFIQKNPETLNFAKKPSDTEFNKKAQGQNYRGTLNLFKKTKRH